MKSTKSHLESTFTTLLQNRASQGRLRRLTLPPTSIVDFSSNAYLSLSTSPDVKRAYISKLQSSDADFTLGSGGSRLLDGNTAAAEALECVIAAFHGAEAGLLFNSGFEANTGLFGCVPQRGDVVVFDELIHASVHDGIKLSRASKVSFSHNHVRDTRGTEQDSSNGIANAASKRKSLDAVLVDLNNTDTGIKQGKRNVFIAVEGVYSMDGDLAPLEAIVQCVEQRLPLGNGYIIVDEAHSTGVIGQHGNGLVCQLGLEGRIFARVHTFGKAMGCAGAIVLCSPITRSYLINYARSLIYTTAMAFPSLMGIQTTYEYLTSGRAEPLRRHLFSLMQHTHALLSAVCARHQPPAETFHINPGPLESPIMPLFTSKARDLALRCQGSGFLVRPIVAPTVPRGTDRVRLCLHAGNSFDEVEGLCRVIEVWVREQLGLTGVLDGGRLMDGVSMGVSEQMAIEKSRL